MRGPPGVQVVAPWVGARLDRDEPVAALAVGQAPAGAVEVGVERGVVVVDAVVVAAGRVGLPDLQERVRDRPPVGIEDPAGEDDPLAERGGAVAAGQVRVRGGDPLGAEQRAGDLGEALGQEGGAALGGAQEGGPVRRGVERRVHPGRPLVGRQVQAAGCGRRVGGHWVAP
jgi:hypothetical protein